MKGPYQDVSGDIKCQYHQVCTAALQHFVLLFGKSKFVWRVWPQTFQRLWMFAFWMELLDMFSSKGLLQNPQLIFWQPNLEAGQLPSSPLQLTGTELSIADPRSQERHFQESGHRPVPRRLLLFGRALIGDFGLCILNPWNVRHTIAKNQTSHIIAK